MTFSQRFRSRSWKLLRLRSSMSDGILLDQFRIGPRRKFKLSNHDPGWSGPPQLQSLKKEKLKEQALAILAQSQTELADVQELLYADDRHALLVILQGM